MNWSSRTNCAPPKTSRKASKPPPNAGSRTSGVGDLAYLSRLRGRDERSSLLGRRARRARRVGEFYPFAAVPSEPPPPQPSPASGRGSTLVPDEGSPTPHAVSSNLTPHRSKPSPDTSQPFALAVSRTCAMSVTLNVSPLI